MPNLRRIATGAALSLAGRLASGLATGDRRVLSREIVRDRQSRAAQALADIGQHAHLAWENAQYDVALNGEAWLLDRLSGEKLETLFDVGANEGDWLRAALRAHPDATVHAFEIVPDTFARLKEAAAGIEGRAVLNDFGLLDAPGTVAVYLEKGTSTHSSTEARALAGKSSSRIDCRVIAGDAYCAEQGIDRIDLLKIDVEGAEMKVLQGFAATLKAGRIGLVQFEYNYCALGSRVLLEDFYAFLEPLGFRLGKLLPDGVRFAPFHPSDENFIGPNYIAVHESRQGWRGLLGLPADSVYLLGRSA